MTDQASVRKICRYCDSPLPAPFLDLGDSALANSYVPFSERGTSEFRCALRLAKCTHCSLVQLIDIVPADLMFRHYLYVSSTTKTFQDHFKRYAEEVQAILKDRPKALAVDIGSNDGLLVDCYQRAGLQALGVDPASNLAEEANRNGRPTINRYFDEACVKEIISTRGKADVISGNNVFAHIDDIQSVMKNVSALLNDDGIFVIEFPYLGVMLDKLYFDMIYHEHVSYIAINPLQFLMNRFDMEIFAIKEVSSHGGSLRVFSKKKRGSFQIEPIVNDYLEKEKALGYLEDAIYEKFSDDIAHVKESLTAWVKEYLSNGQIIAGYGAPAKATTIINYCGFTQKDISFVVDDNPLKQGHSVPGSGIPILPATSLLEKDCHAIVIFAWNFADEIIKKMPAEVQEKVSFFVPLPSPREITSPFTA